MTAKPRIHSVDTFVHVYKLEHPEKIIPSTKTLYNYGHQGLLDIKPIDLPKSVRIRKRKKLRPSTKKHLGTSIEERPEDINDRSTFGHWEIDSVLGLKTAGDPSIMTLVERQTRFAHAYASHERINNEHFNGLLREFVPKGISLKELTLTDLETCTQSINDRPRRIHDYQSAKKRF